jgi:cation:H+ antiporter
MEYIQLIGGLLLLIIGGNYLVESAVDVAKKFHVSSLIIGMTIVAFGTSAPELVVSVQAAINGHPEIAIGNVVGSNIANIGLIMGVTVIILPIIVASRSIKIDWTFMMIISIIVFFAASNGHFTRWEGIIAVLLLIVFTIWSIRNSKTSKDEYEEPKKNVWLNLLIFTVSAAALSFGADHLVEGASKIAKNIGVSERIVSVVIVAVGTSLPELTASIVAALKKQADITIGNIIGSNIFNILFVLGITATIKPINFDFVEFRYDFIWMIIFSILLIIGMLNISENRKKFAESGKFSDLWSSKNGLIGRIWGISMIALYTGYIVSLFH